MTYSHSMFVFVFPAHLPEGDGPAIPHLRLQTPCYHSSAALHQPGSHKGTRSRQCVCYCLCRSCFWLFMPSIGISPSLILFESGTRSLISHPVFFLVHFRWIRRSFSSVRLKHFQLFPQSFQIKTTVWSYTAVFFPKLPLRHSCTWQFCSTFHHTCVFLSDLCVLSVQWDHYRTWHQVWCCAVWQWSTSPFQSAFCPSSSTSWLERCIWPCRTRRR